MIEIFGAIVAILVAIAGAFGFKANRATKKREEAEARALEAENEKLDAINKEAQKQKAYDALERALQEPLKPANPTRGDDFRGSDY